jgi:hypothetical protein
MIQQSFSTCIVGMQEMGMWERVFVGLEHNLGIAGRALPLRASEKVKPVLCPPFRADRL